MLKRLWCRWFGHKGRSMKLIDTHVWLVCPRCNDRKAVKAKAA